MHEYILSNRGVSLALLYEREKQRYVIKSNKKVVIVDEANKLRNITSAIVSNPTNATTDTATTNDTTASGINAVKTDFTSVVSAVSEFVNIKASNNNIGGNISDQYDLNTKSSLQFLKDNNLDLDVSNKYHYVFSCLIYYQIESLLTFVCFKTNKNASIIHLNCFTTR